MPRGPLTPPKIKPLPLGSVLHLLLPGAGWGLGLVLPAPCPSRGKPPTLPCLCPPSCESTGLSHQASGSCLKGGDPVALLPCHGQARQNTFQTAKPLCGGADPPHHSQALGREGKDAGRNKGTGSPGTAGGEEQHYKGTNPHCLALPVSIGDPFSTRKWLKKG